MSWVIGCCHAMTKTNTHQNMDEACWGNEQTELDTDLCQKLNCRMEGHNPMRGHKEMIVPLPAQWVSVLVHVGCSCGALTCCYMHHVCVNSAADDCWGGKSCLILFVMPLQGPVPFRLLNLGISLNIDCNCWRTEDSVAASTCSVCLSIQL